MKKIIEKFNDYRYRKRLLKYFTVNFRLIRRKTVRFFKSEAFRKGIVSSPAIMSYISVFVIALIITGSTLYSEFLSEYFEPESQVTRRLTLQEYDKSVPYLTVLDAFGSSNRIQVTLNTAKENYLLPKGVGLDKGGINLKLTFTDGKSVEFALSNSNYDNFESGMTDTFTVILPFGYTPFDITEYKIVALPDIKNRYDSWHCKWARVYFMLGDTQVMLAKESWTETAVFGEGDGEIRSSTLTPVHTSNNTYIRTEKLYQHYLSLAKAGMTDFSNTNLKSDALDSLSLNGGRYIYLDIETVDIEIQNELLTYFAKGVDIAETDALDYDGLMYLDVGFYTAKEDGSYTETYLLDTLGTDDYELGTTSSFQLELPAGMCVFDIRSMSLRTDNPHDSWAPRYVRAYIKPDFGDRLEIARLNDSVLINTYNTAIFYKNLIDTPATFDLSTHFAMPEVTKKNIEEKFGYSLGENTEKMYFELMNFYDRQLMFYDKLVSLYSKTVYDENVQLPSDEIATPETNDGVHLPDMVKRINLVFPFHKALRSCGFFYHSRFPVA